MSNITATKRIILIVQTTLKLIYLKMTLYSLIVISLWSSISAPSPTSAAIVSWLSLPMDGACTKSSVNRLSKSSVLIESVSLIPSDLQSGFSGTPEN